MQHEIYQSIGLIPGIVGLLFRSLGSHAPTLGDLGLFLDSIPRNFLFVSILLSDCFLPLGLGLRNLRILLAALCLVLLPKTKDGSSNRCKRYRRQNPSEPAQGFSRCRLFPPALLSFCKLALLLRFLLSREPFSFLPASRNKFPFPIRKVLASLIKPLLPFD